MSSFRSIKYQIAAAAALLLSGLTSAAADPADQAQWSESVPLGDLPLVGPGERIEAYIVDGLLHARRLDQNDSPLWHFILAEADPQQPPTLKHLGDAIEVRHANGSYFVRDDLGNALTAHRQRLAPEAFTRLDTTVRQNGIDRSERTMSRGARLPTPAELQQVPPEMFASVDSTALANLVQQLGPEAFSGLDTATLALIKKRVPEAFANPDTTLRQSTIDQSSPTPDSQRGITKWEKDGQLWVALGPHAKDSWDTLIRLTPTVLVPERPRFGMGGGTGLVRWDDAQLLDSGDVLIADYISPAEADRTQKNHRLVRGAVPFNIEVQRWPNPIENGDRIGWFLGKVLVLHFWATWSPESVEQLAHYEELYKKHKNEGLVVIAIHSAEGADEVDAFIAERGYTLPIAVDEGASAQRYGVWTFPQSVLLDRKCRIAWLSQEGETPSQAQLKYLLDDPFPTH
ncbi:MAG: TlpA family protein disulfide reductase [Gemmatimonadetes bacterium]|nr:TlpA family protein disulfide reductase [Gemmatimonadota bacterium]